MLQGLKTTAANQAERLRLVRKLRNATEGTVRIFQKDMRDNLQLPQRRVGIWFTVESMLFVSFVACLTYLAISEKAPEVSREFGRSINDWANRHDLLKVASRRDAIDWVAGLPEFLSEITANNLMAGDVMIGVLRSTLGTCVPPDGIPRIFGAYCLGSFDLSRFDNNAFTGANTSITFNPINEGVLCFGLVCAEGMKAAATTQAMLSYPPPHFRLALQNGDFYVPPAAGNDTIVHIPIQSEIGAGPSHAGERREAITRILEDFADGQTRLLAVEIPMLNPFYVAIVDVWILFEMPVSGGAQPSLDVRAIVIDEAKTTVDFAGGYIFAYSSLHLLILLVSVVWAFAVRPDCVACGINAQVVVFNCVKCASPNELKLEVSACSKCSKPIPSLRHRCWRRILDIWNFWTLCNHIACLVWRYSVLEAVPFLRGHVQHSLERQRQDPDAVSFFSYGQSTQLTRSAYHSVTFCIVLTFIRLFTLLCRGQTSSRFARIFSFGLPELVPFVVTVFFTFSGFCLAMHITLGYHVDLYSTVGSSYLANFRILTLNAEWTSNPDSLDRESATLMVIVFIIVSAFLMMQLFPSVLTVAYKRALATPQYDTQVLSLWLMIKPILRRVGAIRDESSKINKRAFSKSVQDSFTDLEMNDLHAEIDGGQDVSKVDGAAGNAIGNNGDAEGKSGNDADSTTAGAGLEQPLLRQTSSTSQGGSDAGAMLSDLKELDEMRVAVGGSGRNLRAQLDLQQLERLTESAYESGLSQEGRLQKATQELSMMKTEMAELKALLPRLVLAAMCNQRTSQGLGTANDTGVPLHSDVDPAAASTKTSSHTSVMPLAETRNRAATAVIPASSEAIPASALRAAPPPVQLVHNTTFQFVNSDDDDDLVDTSDAAFVEKFFKAYPDGNVAARPATSVASPSPDAPKTSDRIKSRRATIVAPDEV
jgi:hypothetical protein